MSEDEFYYYINDDGLPEAVNIHTGETHLGTINAEDLHKYALVKKDGKMRWVPKSQHRGPQYSTLFADQFVDMLLDGQGIRTVCKASGITYREYTLLRKQYSEFADMVDQARRDRAEIFFENIEKIAKEAEADEDKLKRDRLKLDAYKHLSETADPQRFGKKTQLQGKIGVGILQIETGIRRPGDPGYEETDMLGTIQTEQERIAEGEKDTMVVAQNPNKVPMKAE